MGCSLCFTKLPDLVDVNGANPAGFLKENIMSDASKKLYEGLYLVSQNIVASDPSAVEAELKSLLERGEADILGLRKWDERKLAYDIAGQKRGTYYIAHFRVNPQSLVGIERECNLSDIVIRQMVTKCDHMGDEELQAALQG